MSPCPSACTRSVETLLMARHRDPLAHLGQGGFGAVFGVVGARLAQALGLQVYIPGPSPGPPLSPSPPSVCCPSLSSLPSPSHSSPVPGSGSPKCPNQGIRDMKSCSHQLLDFFFLIQPMLGRFGTHWDSPVCGSQPLLLCCPPSTIPLL